MLHRYWHVRPFHLLAFRRCARRSPLFSRLRQATSITHRLPGKISSPILPCDA
jgi:hypothetical protein